MFWTLTKVDFSHCLPLCAGLQVTGYSKSENIKDLETLTLISKETSAYYAYTKWTTSLSPFKGPSLRLK